MVRTIRNLEGEEAKALRVDSSSGRRFLSDAIREVMLYIVCQDMLLAFQWLIEVNLGVCTVQLRESCH